MNSLYILDKLKMEENCTIEGAIFLTYSIDCKSILATLLKMFTNDNKAENKDQKKTDKRKELTNRFRDLLNNGMGTGKNGVKAYNELKEKIAFVCNDGYDKSVSSPIYWYTKNLTYYYKTEYSFHPKLYIVKYSKKMDEQDRKTETHFRIMVASMNLVDSHNLDMMVVKDIMAYNDEGKDRVKCTILNELLDYNSEEEDTLKNISNRQEELKKVLNNLNLHGLYFDKADIPEFLVFDGNNKPMNGKDIKKVISPFLTVSKDYALRDNLSVYTMESELNKNGWFAYEDELKKEQESNTTKDIKEFWVYQAEKDEVQFNHTKMFIVSEQEKESIYIGSTNFSQAAFNNNKEILVKLEIPNKKVEDFKKCLFREKKNNPTGYVKKTFKKMTGDSSGEEDKLNDWFKKLSSKLSMGMTQEISRTDDGYVCSITINNDKGFNDKNNIPLENGKINITIVPFLMKNESLDIGNIDNNEIKIENNPIKFSVKDRRFIDEKLIFKYTDNDGKKVVAKDFVFSVKTTGLETDDTNASTNTNYMITFLQTFLAEKKANDSMITKDLDIVTQGNSINLSNYCSRLIVPDLEEILNKWIDDETYKPNAEKLETIKNLLEDGKLTATEKKNFGVTTTDEKLINNLCEQWSNLEKEWNEIQRM